MNKHLSLVHLRSSLDGPVASGLSECRINNADNQGHDFVDSGPFLAVEPFASGPVNCPTDRGSKHVARHSGPSATFRETIKHGTLRTFYEVFMPLSPQADYIFYIGKEFRI